MAAGEWALIVAIVLARLLVPLLIPRVPLTIVVALVLDAVDNSLLAALTDVDLGPDGPYQNVDKALDVYYLAIAYMATLRNWTSLPAIRVGQFLFYYRLVGVLAFELLDERAMLFVFPNTFEYYFIAYSILALRYDPRRVGARGWVATAASIWVFVKLPQEYWIHIAQLDFTDTVAEHPWFGVLCALGLLALAAIAQFAVRPRLPAPDHAPTVTAGPLPEPIADCRVRHAYRLRRGEGDWNEFAEKVCLLALISNVFAEILPNVEARPTEIALAVTAIVAANWAISAWDARRHSAELGFAALLAANLALIYLISRFFTAAENFPLATALFFAFLITLMIWLYDVYRPVFDSRFQAARSIITGTSGSNRAQSTVAPSRSK